MKRKYKIVLIAFISSLMTCLVYYYNRNTQITIVSFGDGVADGITNNNMNGISYNYYLKEYTSKNASLIDYSKKNYKLLEFYEDYNNNLDYIRQKVHKGNIVTIFFGEEELSKLAILNDLNNAIVDEYMEVYDSLIKIITNDTNGKVYIFGLYDNAYLNNEKIIYINKKIINISEKYQCIYINTNDAVSTNSIYLQTNDNIMLSKLIESNS